MLRSNSAVSARAPERTASVTLLLVHTRAADCIIPTSGPPCASFFSRARAILPAPTCPTPRKRAELAAEHGEQEFKSAQRKRPSAREVAGAVVRPRLRMDIHDHAECESRAVRSGHARRHSVERSLARARRRFADPKSDLNRAAALLKRRSHVLGRAAGSSRIDDDWHCATHFDAVVLRAAGYRGFIRVCAGTRRETPHASCLDSLHQTHPRHSSAALVSVMRSSLVPVPLVCEVLPKNTIMP
jgi:hypothetical protein